MMNLCTVKEEGELQRSKGVKPEKVQVTQTRGDLRVVKLGGFAILESVQSGETLTGRSTADELHLALAGKVFMLRTK